MAKIAITGAGAAGCFCAVNLARMMPGAQIDVYERGVRPMMKLAQTGDGSCNITNTFQGVSDLKEVYPRGFRFMKRALNEFGPKDARQWFREVGVGTVVEGEGRVFPESQDAMQVVSALMYAMRQHGILIHCNHVVRDLSGFKDCDAVIVTTGGGSLKLLRGSGVAVESCVPSLFGFRISDLSDRCSSGEPGSSLKSFAGMSGPVAGSLSGVSVEEVSLALCGTGFRSCGSLVITRDGFSGPAVLRLSSYAARYLAVVGYNADLSVNWLNVNEQQCRDELKRLTDSNPAKLLRSIHPEQLPSALWQSLLGRCGLRADMRCAELGSKGFNRLAGMLCNDVRHICGRAAHKEEFVTCGGVSLGDVNSETLESKSFPGLFFAGEVLDIDAVTGGFNLQAAWTTGYLAARGVVSVLGRANE